MINFDGVGVTKCTLNAVEVKTTDMPTFNVLNTNGLTLTNSYFDAYNIDN